MRTNINKHYNDIHSHCQPFPSFYFRWICRSSVMTESGFFHAAVPCYAVSLRPCRQILQTNEAWKAGKQRVAQICLQNMQTNFADKRKKMPWNPVISRACCITTWYSTFRCHYRAYSLPCQVFADRFQRKNDMLAKLMYALSYKG